MIALASFSCAIVALLAAPASALTISFTSTDLAAPGPGGGDLWRYEYALGGYTPQANVAFELLFDPALYRSLEDPPSSSPGWSVLTLQPDPLIPDPGRYSALALVNGAPVVGPFTVTFVWLGGAGRTPGLQPFELNQFDPAGTFISTLATGQTQSRDVPPPVPEPSTLSLLLIAAPALARRRLTVTSRGRSTGLQE